MSITNNNGVFCISLDFELYWGMSDVIGAKDFKKNTDQVRSTVIKSMLDCFAKHNVHATWAAVGGICAKDLEDYMYYAPDKSKRPSYTNEVVSTYGIIENEDLKEMLFSPESIRLISSYSGQELGSHTFSHYYCTEKGQTLAQFEADLDSVKAISEKNGFTPTSIIFPRNQIDNAYIKACCGKGFKSYRSIENNWIYNNVKITIIRRGLRFLDAYFPISGHNTHDAQMVEGMVNITGSRLFRPYSKALRFLEPLKVRRIKKQMLYAAKHGTIFHLWWHPHNFSTFTEQNISNLDKVLSYYETLKEKYGLESMNMGEIEKCYLIQ